MQEQQPNTPPRANRSWGFLIAVSAGLATTVILFWIARQSELNTFQLQFESGAATRSQLIIQRVYENISDIQTIESLFKATDRADRSTFRVFTAFSLKDRPDLRVLEWVPCVGRAQRTQWEQQERSGGLANYRITQRALDGRYIPAADREIHYPVSFVEPRMENDETIGFDLASDPIRLAALERARDSGQPATTERLELLDEKEGQFGVLVIVPHYQKGKPTATVRQRREAIQGFIVGGFRVVNLLQAALTTTPPIGVTIDVLDLSAADGGRLLHHWVSRDPGTPTWKTRLVSKPPRHLERFLCGDREWGVLLTANDAYLSRQYPLRTWVILPVGLLLTLLLGLYLQTIRTQRERMERTVLQRTAELTVANQVLQAEIVQRNQAEESLRRQAVSLKQANSAAQAATKMKSEFLANMSHEIRTPMTAILGFTDILFEENRELKCSEYLQVIKRNGEQLLTLINDILDLSKIEAGQLDVNVTSCSPKEILEDVKTLMQLRAEDKGIGLSVEYLGPIPAHICTDAARFRQILINLVGNAVKFTEQGSVRIVVQMADHNRSNLQCDVFDTGVGMTPEQMTRLFQGFSQGDSSTTRRFGGTGLGLAISKRLAERLGGEIVLMSSRPDIGSQFRLTLPVGVPESELAASPGDGAASAAAQPLPNLVSLEGVRVLLAEDGPDNQRLLAFLLKRANVEVTVVENGLLAVTAALAAQAEGRPFDVILMDMQMSLLDGYEATRRLREKGYLGPIIALTAHAMVEDRQNCLDVGCNDYAAKPISRQTLLGVVAKYAGRESWEAPVPTMAGARS